MASKVTFLFGQTSSNPNSRTVNQANGTPFGWSETWFSDLNAENTSLYALILQFIRLRCKLLGSYAGCVGYRVTGIDPPGQTFSYRKNVPGTSGLNVDNVEQSLLIPVQTGDGKNRRMVTLRGTPDARMALGNYSASQVYDDAVRELIADIELNWKFRGKKRTLPTSKILTISLIGVIKTETPHGIADGGLVQVYRSQSPEKRQWGIKRVKVAVISPTEVQLPLNAKIYAPAVGGKLVPFEGEENKTCLFAPQWFEQMRASTRQTGRPFFLRAGRRSARRV